MRVVVFLSAAALAFSQQTGIVATTPITAAGRLKWAALQTVGPAPLAADVAIAGVLTLYETPREYDTHWEGFAKRIGMPMTIVAVSNTMEAGLGAAWGEDPRYFRDPGRPFLNRLGHVVKFTFLATNSRGQTTPAIARYVAFAGSNYLANQWMPPSQANSPEAAIRIGLSFASRMTSNAFVEFWPDMKKHLFHRVP